MMDGSLSYPARDYVRRQRWIDALTAAAIVLVTLASASALALGISPLIPLALLTVAGGSVAIGVLWRRPVRIVYLLVLCALVVEQYAIVGLDPVTTHIPFYQTLSGAFRIPVSVSPAELILLLGIAAVLLPPLARKRRPSGFYRGALFGPMMFFLLAIVVAFLNGFLGVFASSGYWQNAAWAEGRSFVYLIAAYVLASNLVVTREDLTPIVWILVLGLGFKGFQGIQNYVSEQQQGLHLEAITAHEDVLFYAAFFLFLAALFVYRGPRRLRKVMLWCLPALAFTDLATSRRIAFFVLGAGALVFAAALFKSRKRLFMRIAPPAVVLLTVYAVIFWNHPYNTVGQPIRAFRSQFGFADARDQSSDQWRVLENQNITLNIRQAGLTGLGFGRQYTFYVAEPNLLAVDPTTGQTTGFVYWTYITHDSVFWVWMKMGVLGFVAFWYLIGSAVVVGIITVRRLNDGYLRAIALTTAGLVVMQVVFSYGDLGLTYSRTMILLGCMLGVLVRLPELDTPPEPVPVPASTPRAVERTWSQVGASTA